MRAARLYVETGLAANTSLALPERAAHHAARVLRLRAGHRLVLFDGRGGEYDAVVEAGPRNAVTVAIGMHRETERESPLGVVLAQGISGAERMDFTIQKAVELGVAAIQPLATERSVVRLDAERAQTKLAHWQRIVIAACEQCGRNRLPMLRAPVSVRAFCDEPSLPVDRWLLAPGATGRIATLGTGLANGVVLAAGPEAGFSDDEAAHLAAAGFAALSLGPRVLRTETAAIAALGALNALAGDG
ncbi:MAG: 16S rRNA (uracil(1498)-N(3))-methyltransferase [Proteobacteria bacterium]|nr:16S rRNA (uracil(1498)-N(3))-methyltransferase [Pseudomonadota bacterium]